ncbi:18257_t:CDS:2, partial [Racocetra persica]
MKASTQVANIIWKGIWNIAYVSCCIREWAKDFIVQGFLSSYQQRKYAKRLSLFSDEDISLVARTWLRSVSLKDCSSLTLKKELETTIFSKFLGIPVIISKTTVRKFIHLLGFRRRAVEQQVYFDGHKREDIQEYRKSWASKIINYRKKIEEYSGDEIEIVVLPERLEICDTHHIIVTYDEVYFYANNDMIYVWLEDSSNRDNYWKSENIVRQLRKKAIPIFNLLYPRCIDM